MNKQLAMPLARDCLIGLAVVAAVTGASWLLTGTTGYEAVALVYLLAVVLLAAKLNRWATLLVAALSALLWNFLFIPPLFTFHIASAQDALMFGMFFVVAITVGHLTNQLRMRELAERRRQRRTAALNRLFSSVAGSTSLAEGLAGAVREVDTLFGARTRIDLDGTGQPAPGDFVSPLETSNGRFGRMIVALTEPRPLTLDERELLETFAAQIAALVERYRLLERAEAARLTEHSERLHRTLLDSVSHELKTPLAVVEAATDGLATQLEQAALPLAQTFLDEIKAANHRLRRIVDNLLDMTRIETGRVALTMEWCEVRDLLESAVEQLKNEVSPERVQITVSDGTPLVQLDFGLMEQALYNLLTNAVSHSPAGAPVQLQAGCEEGQLVVRVSDQGAGLLPGEETKVFEKFYRGPRARPGGTGLGLSIAQGIVRAHHGEVSANNNPAGGATFTIRVPV